PTPPELLPSEPGRILALSGLDNVDLYSGHLSLSLPLRHIGGRGDAGYTMTLAVSNPPWAIENTADNSGGLPGSSNPWTYTSIATAKWWHPFQTRYSPGFVVARSSFENLGTCAGAQYFLNTMTTLVFLRPDGSELTLYAQKNAGGPIFASCVSVSGGGTTLATGVDAMGNPVLDLS